MSSAPPRVPTPSRSATGRLGRGVRMLVVALRGAPGPFAVGVAASAVFAAATVGASLALRWATDEVLVPSLEGGELDWGLLGAAFALIVAVGMAKGLGVVGRRFGAYVAQYRLQSTHRRAVTHRYLQLPASWHRRHSTGQLLSNANADVEQSFFIAAPLPMALGALLMLAITGVLLVATDPLLAAIGFSIGPALIALNWWYQRRMRPVAAAAQADRAETAEVAHESFDSALVVKAMGREAAETDRFAARANRLRDRLISIARLRAAFDPVIEGLPNIGILLVLLVGAGRVAEGALSAGDLVLFAYLFRLVALPVRIFGFLLGELARAVVSYDRLRRVLDADEDLPYGAAASGGAGGARVDAEAVTYRHPPTARDELSEHDLPPGAAGAAGAVDDGRRGVEDVDLTLPAGATVALVGATGSGKSTLASLLVRLHDPDRGEIRLDGAALPGLTADALARDVAMVFQEAFLFDDTVRGNITLGEDFTDAEVEAAARLARAHEVAAALPEGYETQVGERGSTLSGGQRQRIALARALVRRPRLLVLDDATSAVDPGVEADILRNLASAELPSTVLLVAHRPSAIALADEVILVADGRVAARGTHERLLADSPDYARLVTAYAREAERQAAERAASEAAR